MILQDILKTVQSVSLLAFLGCTSTSDLKFSSIDTTPAHKSKLFDTKSKKYLIYDGVDLTFADANVVIACKRHYQKNFKANNIFEIAYLEPKLFRLIQLEGLHFYLFRIPGSDGSIMVYSYDPNLKIINQRFFIPTS